MWGGGGGGLLRFQVCIQQVGRRVETVVPRKWMWRRPGQMSDVPRCQLNLKHEGSVRTGVGSRQVLGGRDQDRCQFQAGVGWQRPGQVSVSGRCWVAGTRTGVSFRQVLGGRDQDSCQFQAGVG